MKIHDITGSLRDSPAEKLQLRNEGKSVAASDIRHDLDNPDHHTPDLQSILAQDGCTPPMSKVDEKITGLV